MTLDYTKKITKEELLDKVQDNAEELFRSGTFFCSESVVQTINDLLEQPFDGNVVKLASGFPIGMGKSGCRVITKEWSGDNFQSEGRRQHCITITGKVARWIANELIEDGQIQVK